MKFYLDLKNGVYTLKELRVYLSSLKDGLVTIEVKRERNTRSNQQNGYLWKVVYPMVLDGLVEAGWDDFTNIEDVHEYCKRRFLTREFVNRRTGEIMEAHVSTTECDTAEFSSYVDSIRDWSAEYLGVYIPEPIKEEER